ncbi:MAG TPA: CaiB/BaiF CoA-transferase family protein [Pirellulales bacterium]|jgi:crotonobetainyl-CoA:carnitine CoA-transferase CaiB-like acyl-CoA transferase
MAPLEGCHVIDLSLLLPGPLATQILRDLGARVTKVEPPAPGDYMAYWPPMAGDVSATYATINRGKEILTLNLKEPTDRERFYELVRTADVVLEGFRPGVIDKLQIGYAKLSEINPRIVLCSISGYGQTGPYAQRAGHDLNYQALAGVLSIAGGNAATTPNPQLQVADTAAGSYAAAMLILAALLERHKTNRGRHIDVSMSEQLLPLMATLFAAADALGSNPQRDGELLSGGAPCYRIFRTSDDHHITVGALEPKFWVSVCERLRLPEMATARFHGCPDVDNIESRLAEVFATKTRAEWIEIFGDSDSCVEPVLSFAEVRELSQWQARRSFLALKTPAGVTLRVPKMPASLAGFDTEEGPA